MKTIFKKSIIVFIIETIIQILLTNIFEYKTNNQMYWIITIPLVIILIQFILYFNIKEELSNAHLKYKKLKKGIEIVATRTGCIDEIKNLEQFIIKNKDIIN